MGRFSAAHLNQNLSCTSYSKDIIFHLSHCLTIWIWGASKYTQVIWLAFLVWLASGFFIRIQKVFGISINFNDNCTVINIFQILKMALVILDLLLPNRRLLVQSKQWKHLNNLWNLFKVNNKDTRTMSLSSLGVFIVKF